MKALRTHLILTSIALMLTACYSTNGVYAQGGYYNQYDDSQGAVTFNVFYNELRPYGRWINHRAYGQIWIPNVGGNFQPYATNGYWVMTDYGNTWVSDYSWGWAPFHYGRWYYDESYGWAWVPGYEWAPAWVTWRSGGGYYGWAPMTPGINIHININLPARYWTFLPHNRMYHRNMHKYYSRYSPAIYNRTTIIQNTYVYNDNRYYSGPSARDYERTTGRKATVHKLESSNNRSGRATTRVSNNAVKVFRPDVTNSRSAVNQRSSSTTTTRQSSTSPASRSSSTTNRNATVRTQSPARSNSAVSTPQRSSTSNRSSTTVRSQSSTSNRQNSTATRSSSGRNNSSERSKSESSGRSSGRR